MRDYFEQLQTNLSHHKYDETPFYDFYAFYFDFSQIDVRMRNLLLLPFSFVVVVVE